MEWFEFTCLVILLVYTVFIQCNMLILLSQKKELLNLENYHPTTPVTILIPARNEEKNVLNCLKSISLQDFPKNLLQVIVVDDNSTDDTSAITENYLRAHFTDYKLIFLENSAGKKAAILKAIEQSSGKIIITRDADSYANNPLWLKSITVNFENTSCDLLISPLILSGKRSFLFTFQQLENLAIMGVGTSMAKINLPFVCSGANLAYKKEKFLRLQPYKDNMGIASGDDMFLLSSFYNHNCKIKVNGYSGSIVYSATENSLKMMLFQRLRWASKTGKIITLPVLFTGILVLLANLVCLFALCLLFINSCYLTFSLFTLTLKFIIDFLLLFLSARMYKQKVNWLWLPIVFLLNGIYLPVISIASIFVKPNWKGRSV